MTSPAISIIVPCYNQAQYLDECLQSVLDQTWQDWECIIVNDGSLDNTEEVAEKWCRKDSRFRYFNKVNGGVSSARNYGVENASGEWILPLDSDDRIANQYLELAESEFINGYDIIYCEAEFFGEQTGKWLLRDFIFEQLLLENLIFCSGFYRKSSWRRTGGYDVNFHQGFEDWEFWINLLKSSTSKKVLRLNYTGFFYRRKIVSRDVTVNKSKEKIDTIEKMIFDKHKEAYYTYYENPIKCYRKNGQLYLENQRQSSKINTITNEINLNLFTRILYKLITLFNK